MTINGNVEYVYGGSDSGDVNGNINIVINGGVYAGGHNADAEIGDVHKWYSGTVTSGCLEGDANGDITTTINENATVYSVIGGGDLATVTGNTNVHVYGNVLKLDDTANSSNRALWMMVMAFSGVGLVAALVLSKRLNPKEKRTRHYKAKYYK